MKKILLLLFILTTQIAGCSKNSSFSEEEKAILDYDFLYNQTPGDSLSYKMMWDGYDDDNMFGPCISYENRLYTFLLEYKEINDGYNLVYLKNSVIDKCSNYLIEHRNDYLIKTNFTIYSDIKTIDGKFLYAYKHISNKYNGDIVFKYANRLNDITYSFGDYSLAFVFRKKELLIKQNVSTNNSINNIAVAFSRHVISISKEQLELISYDGNSNFDYVGDRLEVYPLDFETMSFTYFPRLGLINTAYQKTIRSDIYSLDNNCCLLLPRYILNGSETIDLLDDSYSFITYEDVFREYKEDFLNFLFCDNYLTSKSYSYSLFLYNKVIDNIIFKGEKQ